MKLIHYACLITALLKPTISHVTVSLKNLIKILRVCICAVLCIQNWSQSSYAWQNVCQICLSICFHNWVIFSHICYSKAWSYSCISKEFIRERERKRERERERGGYVCMTAAILYRLSLHHSILSGEMIKGCLIQKEMKMVSLQKQVTIQGKYQEMPVLIIQCQIYLEQYNHTRV